MIPNIDSIYELADFDFTVMLWRDMIKDSEFNPFGGFILGVQDRRVQSEHGVQMVMIRGVQRLPYGSSWILYWDPRTTVFYNLTIDIDDMANFRFPYFILGMIRIGFLEEWSYEELTQLV
jgi:hypothetical protein